jgi:TusA-related sulfurtransferase
MIVLMRAREVTRQHTVVKLQLVARKMQDGQVIEGAATDPGVMADIPEWVRTSGNELISIEQQGKEYHFVVKNAD